jgi:transcriptional regulator with XRE-family HTH domain
MSKTMGIITEEEQKKQIADTLKELIKKSGKVQKAIALDLDINPPTFNQWVTGRVIPQITMLKKVAAYFNVDLMYLLDKEEYLEEQRNTLPKEAARKLRALRPEVRVDIYRLIDQLHKEQIKQNTRNTIDKIIKEDHVTNEQDAETFISGISQNLDLLSPYGEILLISMANDLLPIRKEKREPSGEEYVTLTKNMLDRKQRLKKRVRMPYM